MIMLRKVDTTKVTYIGAFMDKSFEGTDSIHIFPATMTAFYLQDKF